MNTPVGADTTFGAVLGAAVRHRGLTLERLGERLAELGTPVSIATLSYWQSGRSVPTRGRSLKAVEHLEKILDVSPGHLLNALPGNASSHWDPAAVLGLDDQLEATLTHLGLDLDRHLSTLTLQDEITVDVDGLTQLQTTRQLVRAEHDGITHSPLVFSEAPDAPQPPLLAAGPGCSIARQVVLSDQTTVVGELVLPRTLHRGDMAMFTYQVQWGPAEPQHSYIRALASPVDFLVLQVEFLGDAPGRACHRHRTRGGSPAQEHPLAAGRHLQHSLRHAPAGEHEMAWSQGAVAPDTPTHPRTWQE